MCKFIQSNIDEVGYIIVINYTVLLQSFQDKRIVSLCKNNWSYGVCEWK